MALTAEELEFVRNGFTPIFEDEDGNKFITNLFDWVGKDEEEAMMMGAVVGVLSGVPLGFTFTGEVAKAVGERVHFEVPTEHGFKIAIIDGPVFNERMAVQSKGDVQ
ncbi:hypothetical protein LCGC14_0693700 [marine sediment metagenome]|uniref:Uncharacterized protein n=1 Tax=marine sediment metagenome TaxID=412755 RepID=A0A0F9QPN2_9ZZZZ